MDDKNRITISRGGSVPPQRVSANGHEVDRGALPVCFDTL